MSNATNTGGPAFPLSAHPDHGYGPAASVHEGMSLRVWFATHAPDVPGDFEWAAGETDTAQRMVRWRWHYADMMIRTMDGGAGE